jgi:hypothetical protein
MYDREHATLANTLCSVLNMGFNRFGFEAPESLHRALKDCRDSYGFYGAEKIYRRLYELNAAAYTGRYNGHGIEQDEAETVPDMPAIPAIITDRQYFKHELLQPWHYKFCKMLDCLIYQCSEHATEKDPLFLSLIDFNRLYKSFLVSNIEAYYALPWGRAGQA